MTYTTTTTVFFTVSLLMMLLNREIHSFSTTTTIKSRNRSRHNYEQRRNTVPCRIPSSTSCSTRRSRRPSTGTTTTTTTSLFLTAVATPVAAITGVVTGGILGGGLHAIAGPDHLAALLPRCCGQRWYNAGRIGTLWGIGHGIAVTILGVLGYALKAQFTKAGPGADVLLSGASHFMEIAVGLSLIVMGALSLREARAWGEEMEENAVVPTKSLSAAVTPTSTADGKSSSGGNQAILLNGLLHGFSWDGAPSLAPALAVASWGDNLAFLSAYGVGTVVVMAVATSFFGEGTRQASEVFNRPDLPQKLSFCTSLLSIAIGSIWCGLALT
eukprot:CAMPEP_0170817318 /NCGR_PEP_ID=MMETSP0733-20121128/39952_1 /TAXON_ID=186038 /ORGANISM="Fragilariopsis kerguelensis, Strain L26-C5" /LENGTH=327 /DNA_ID=CAMNT_0011176983 /DNA_START=195 /DNA_END=1178 /DNA_ORIENTATION=+